MKDAANPEGASGPVLVVGIDGATWDVMMPLAEEGKLPNIKALMDSGAHGTLRSLEPMMSPIVWTSIATGVLPAKHGIGSFYGTQESLRYQRVWEVLAAAGKTIGIFEWLVTSPPHPIPHFIVPGWLATSSETFPPDLAFVRRLSASGKSKGGMRSLLRDLLYEGPRHGVKLRTLLASFMDLLSAVLQPPDFYALNFRKTLAKTRIYADVASHLLKKYRPDFSAVVLYATDQIPHHYWKFMEPDMFEGLDPKAVSRYGNVMEKTYRIVDSAVGRLVDSVPADTTVMLISDHGMEPITDDIRFVFKTGDILDLCGIEQRDRLDTQLLNKDIHITVQGETEAEKNTIAASVAEALRKITVQESGEPLLAVSHDACDNVTASTTSRELDVDAISLCFPGKEEAVPMRELVVQENLLSAKHAEKGIFVIKGPHIPVRGRVSDASILDVAPTLLYSMGVPVARDMDGRVLTELFEEEIARQASVEYVESYSCADDRETAGTADSPGLSDQQRADVRDRLRNLGYLD